MKDSNKRADFGMALLLISALTLLVWGISWILPSSSTETNRAFLLFGAALTGVLGVLVAFDKVLDLIKKLRKMLKYDDKEYEMNQFDRLNRELNKLTRPNFRLLMTSVLDPKEYNILSDPFDRIQPGTFLADMNQMDRLFEVEKGLSKLKKLKGDGDG